VDWIIIFTDANNFTAPRIDFTARLVDLDWNGGKGYKTPKENGFTAQCVNFTASCLDFTAPCLEFTGPCLKLTAYVLIS
jgi:hypothetical protein